MKDERAARIPYTELVDIPEGSNGRFSITHNTTPAGFNHFLSPVRARMLGGQPPGMVRYEHATQWTKLEEEGGGVWMSDSVCEQEQHWRALAGMHGRVLVGGLGLGMAVSILAANNDVDEILVIEREVSVAGLVWPHVAVPRAELMISDIDVGLKSLRSHLFDFAFLDTWASDSERTLFEEVIPLRDLIYRNNVARVVKCWNEDVMRGQLKFGLIGRWSMVYLAPTWAGAETPEDRKALLCDVDNEDPDVRWAAPFFAALEKADAWDVFESHNMVLAEMYAALYGLPGWEESWRALAPILIGEI